MDDYGNEDVEKYLCDKFEKYEDYDKDKVNACDESVEVKVPDVIDWDDIDDEFLEEHY